MLRHLRKSQINTGPLTECVFLQNVLTSENLTLIKVLTRIYGTLNLNQSLEEVMSRKKYPHIPKNHLAFLKCPHFPINGLANSPNFLKMYS